MQPRFVARTSASLMILIVLGSMAIIAAGAVIAGLLWPPPPMPRRAWVGWMAMIVGAAGVILGLKLLLEAGEDIVVDGSGIRVRRWSDHVIPWDAIDRIEERSNGYVDFICIHLKQPGFPPISDKPGRRTQKQMGFGDIAMNPAGTDKSYDQVVEAIEQYRPMKRTTA